MYKNILLLFAACALALSACGTFEVRIEDGATALPPAKTLTPSATLPTPTVPSATRTPAAILTPTATPAVTPTSSCDLAEFIADVTVPDGTSFKPLETFTKTWRLRNAGGCTWNAQYAVVFVLGEAMLAPQTKALLGSVVPGEMVDVSVDLTAPETPGIYSGYWVLENASGTRVPIVGSSDATFYVNIRVVPEPASFRVTVDSLSVSCQKPDFFTVTAAITSNGPGTINYRISNGGSEPPATTALAFENATTKTVTRDIPFSVIIPSHPELSWVQIQISGPNQELVSDQDPLQCP